MKQGERVRESEEGGHYYFPAEESQGEECPSLARPASVPRDSAP